MTKAIISVNAVIVGGGVAGLWLFNRLLQLGYSAVLIEKSALGRGQTICSQGIIHSGVKYALTGKLSGSAQQIKAMPELWQQCLSGDGEIDLSVVNVLSQSQYLWSPGSLSADLTTFFASKSLSSRVKKISKEQCPEVFQHQDFKGSLYQLHEPVLEVASLLQALAAPVKENIIQANLNEAKWHKENGQVTSVELADVAINADSFVLTAGEANRQLQEALELKKPKMQLRPLHMAYVKGRLPQCFAHCMHAGTKPRLTITTYQINDEQVWYLGGDIAETGVDRNGDEQKQAVIKELSSLMPWLDFLNIEVGCFRINRAEAKQRFGRRPELPSVSVNGNVVSAWPTKLAFSPLLANQVIAKSFKDLVRKKAQGSEHLKTFAKPVIATPPWE